MTLTEAKQVAESVLGEEIYTPESLVRKFFNASCFLNPVSGQFEVYGDGVLVGQALNPEYAWLNAVDSLPEFVFENFEQHFHFDIVYYQRRNQSDAEKSSTGSQNTSRSTSPS